MNFLLQFVSRDSSACGLVGTLKERAFPKDAMAKLRQDGHHIAVKAIHALSQNEEETVTAVVENAGDADCCVVVLDTTTAASAAWFSPFFLVVEAEASLGNRLAKNVLSQAYTKAFKRAKAVRVKFEDRKTQKLLLLPAKNCVCPELPELFRLCDPSLPSATFGEVLEVTLKSLRSRVDPKTNTARPETYIKDDSGRHFRLGHEKHAQADDAQPPHTGFCKAGKQFRLGMRLDEYLHFNVSEAKGLIGGEFRDCHDTVAKVSGETHLNMFPNGFY